MSLKLYNKKRNFKETAEPKGKISKESQLRFVVQRHHASRIHYDFRLEMGGTLKSWAVPKGPSLNPSVKRLAVLVEDHPVSYISFEGIIPKGNYGAGTVEVWDDGHYVPVNEKGLALDEKTALNYLKKGSLKFRLKGKKLKGEFALVRLKKDDKSWLLIKHRDRYAVDTDYNSEDHSRHRKLEDRKNKGTKRKSISTKKKSAPQKLNSLKQRKLSDFIKPMLASTAAHVIDGDEWLFELKWDGYRAIAEVEKGEIRLYSRNGLSFREKYPVITEALSRLKHSAILDGEIVLLDEEGKPSFQKLQHYEDNTGYPLVYYVFDLLKLNGKDTKELELVKRKELLKKLLGRNKTIKYCDHIDKNGTAFYKKVVSENMEGIIAKYKESTYHPGTRSKFWLKIKNIQSQEAVIAGYTAPRGSRAYFGALILGQYDRKKLEYIGHTGTGFNQQTLKELHGLMKPLVTKNSPFEKKIKVNAPVTWVKPRLVVEVSYTEMTEDNNMRHPVFMKYRPDKDGEEAVWQPAVRSRQPTARSRQSTANSR